ncbi:MAG TPA: hypothetical protein VKN18_19445 [Blastocatellia bacterium]|nr:hypothetical protein [Blastocatellia bacterium]
MKRALALTSILIASLVLVAGAAQSDVNVTGEWAFTVETPQGSGTPTFTFKQEGEKLTGNYKGQFGEAPLTGTVKGGEIKFTIKISAQGQELMITYTGKIESKDSMKGTAVLGEIGEATWTAKRK